MAVRASVTRCSSVSCRTPRAYCRCSRRVIGRTMRGVGNALKTALLLGALSALILLIGRLLGGTTGLLIAGLVALGINGLSYFYSDKLALRAMRAQRVAERQAPQLHAIVADLVSRRGLPMPGVYTSPSSTPNAFATWPEPLACGGLCHDRDPRRTGRAGVARGAGARDQPSAVVDLVLIGTDRNSRRAGCPAGCRHLCRVLAAHPVLLRVTAVGDTGSEGRCRTPSPNRSCCGCSALPSLWPRSQRRSTSLRRSVRFDRQGQLRAGT